MSFFNFDNKSNYIDRLTSLPNKNYYIDNLYQTALKMVNDRKKDIVWTVMFCDIDGLKLVNDLHGHTEGDMIIKKMADIIKDCIIINRGLSDGPVDGVKQKDNINEVIHLGGDEFVIILSKCNKTDAKLIKDCIYNKVNEDNNLLGATLSIGISDTMDIPLKDDIDVGNSKSVLTYIREIIHLADRNMYSEKNNFNSFSKDELLNHRLKCINRMGNQIGIDFTLEESNFILSSIEDIELKRNRMN